MKKIAIFLVVVFCLSLCACQNTESEKKYAYIVSMLDSGDYEGAIDAIRDMGGIPESSEVSSSQQSEVTSSVETSSKEPSSTEISSEEPSSVETSSAETISTTTVKHGKVEITLDNWDEYFEFVTEEKWEENAFGEATRLTFLYYFQPKEEYADKIRTNTNFSVAVEYTCTKTSGMNPIPATLDYENRTYTLGEFPSDTVRLKRDFKYTGYPETVGEFARVLAGDLYEYCWDFNVTRIEGAIYLK